MKRIILMVVRCIVFVPFWFYQIKKYGNTEKYSEEEAFTFVHRLMGKICRAGRVEIDAKGMEQLPKENGYILFSNHQGLFDSLVFFKTHERPFGIVIKKEMSNVFFVKDIIRLVRGIYIDRDDIRQSMSVIKQMAKEVKTASPKPQQHENPRYAMRTWLLRLGFIGEEFRTAREILTRRLSGDTAFRNGRAA